MSAFLDSIGYDTVDAGPLAEGWRFQRDTAAYGAPYFDPSSGKDPWTAGTGRCVTAEAMRAALAAAKRYRDM